MKNHIEPTCKKLHIYSAVSTVSIINSCIFSTMLRYVSFQMETMKTVCQKNITFYHTRYILNFLYLVCDLAMMS